MKVLNFLFVATLLIMMTSCGDDDDTTITPQTAEFTVTIENIFTAKDHFTSGTTGFLDPGASESFSFDAGQGHYLSLATMLVQSNDLFYAPNMNGIPLYDNNGTALTGNVTGLIDLWDAGTEMNEAPGTGANQAPRQTGPDTGAAENGIVLLIEDVADGYTYPEDETMIQVTLAHDGNTQFTVTIQNISNNAALPSPFAPGVWVVSSADKAPLFATGAAATIGLERLAEDGNNGMLDMELQENAGLVSPFAPGAYAVYTTSNPIFVDGTNASAGLEALAEDGNNSTFDYTFSIPFGAADPAPIFPTESYSFSFTANEGDMLSFATMLVQTNDLFVGPEGIDLFPGGTALDGDITADVKLWDAYTEVNEFPGAGNNQAPRQAAANTGTSESAGVALVNDAFTYPAINDMVKVTISAKQ